MDGADRHRMAAALTMQFMQVGSCAFSIRNVSIYEELSQLRNRQLSVSRGAPTTTPSLHLELSLRSERKGPEF